MQRLIGSLCIFACLCLLHCDPADAAGSLPYAAVPWQVMPELPPLPDEASLLALYPDWDDSLLQSLGYREQQTYYHGTRALVTARFDVEAFVTVLHYSSDGNCYISQPASRIIPKQQITFSVLLPDGQQGITRVIFWRSIPAAQLTEALAGQTIGELPVTQLLYEAWFPRTDRHESGLPYEPEQFRMYDIPPSFSLTEIPAARSQLSLEYITYSKDCCVIFNGRLGIGNDDWGSRGEWEISWGDTLIMEVYLPQDLRFTDAVLRLYVSESSSVSQGEHENLVLRVNGREVLTGSPASSISVQAKHVDYELGQYMYPGLNVIELKLDAFSTSDWLLQTAEVWIR
ncbi:MAG: hypothetical protein H7A35_02350 [Planctomycetales bacterium]|nr:hypothetical protein [bacterium]UNM08901.1 MAG: hypothetical protein H7A35_02350 [Planctomycetales bacterium]